jgi:hypothetical protein
MEKNVKDAISVLIQVAQLAQTKGVLTLNDAFIVKSSIDILNEALKDGKDSDEAVD